MHFSCFEPLKDTLILDASKQTQLQPQKRITEPFCCSTRNGISDVYILAYRKTADVGVTSFSYN